MARKKAGTKGRKKGGKLSKTELRSTVAGYNASKRKGSPAALKARNKKGGVALFGGKRRKANKAAGLSSGGSS